MLAVFEQARRFFVHKDHMCLKAAILCHSLSPSSHVILQFQHEVSAWHQSLETVQVLAGIQSQSHEWALRSISFHPASVHSTVSGDLWVSMACGLPMGLHSGRCLKQMVAVLFCSPSIGIL